MFDVTTAAFILSIINLIMVIIIGVTQIILAIMSVKK